LIQLQPPNQRPAVQTSCWQAFGQRGAGRVATEDSSTYICPTLSIQRESFCPKSASYSCQRALQRSLRHSQPCIGSFEQADRLLPRSGDMECPSSSLTSNSANGRVSHLVNAPFRRSNFGPPRFESRQAVFD
jgi:hypothetical protein